MADRYADDLARTIAFQRAILTRTSTRIVPSPFGRAFLDDRYRVRWDSNLLWVERGASADDLADEADRILGGAGLLHREIRVDDDDVGGMVADGLAAHGYDIDRLVVMRSTDEIDPPAADDPVGEVDLSTLRPAIETVIRREPYGSDEGTVAVLASYRGELVRNAGARFFCARVGDEIVSMCDLYQDGPIAQIEDVNTLQEFRDRGFARSVIRRAVAEATAAGAELLFLEALADDWPKELYAKLGFSPIGHVWSFVRAPGRAKSPV